ncbi:unnamed protein product [Paramecium octaurelia]|uniref:Uncharacterized protein n=1 Tax=Paramecium octaurelia TaxID=43137 RepID=A0A8S1VJD2_PAROT|nr:unnamed protein product [Paramecium octaurelia]
MIMIVQSSSYNDNNSKFNNTHDLCNSYSSTSTVMSVDGCQNRNVQMVQYQKRVKVKLIQQKQLHHKNRSRMCYKYYLFCNNFEAACIKIQRINLFQGQCNSTYKDQIYLNAPAKIVLILLIYKLFIQIDQRQHQSQFMLSLFKACEISLVITICDKDKVIDHSLGRKMLQEVKCLNFNHSSVDYVIQAQDVSHFHLNMKLLAQQKLIVSHASEMDLNAFMKFVQLPSQLLHNAKDTYQFVLLIIRQVLMDAKTYKQHLQLENQMKIVRFQDLDFQLVFPSHPLLYVLKSLVQHLTVQDRLEHYQQDDLLFSLSHCFGVGVGMTVDVFIIVVQILSKLCMKLFWSIQIVFSEQWRNCFLTTSKCLHILLNLRQLQIQKKNKNCVWTGLPCRSVLCGKAPDKPILILVQKVLDTQHKRKPLQLSIKLKPKDVLYDNVQCHKTNKNLTANEDYKWIEEDAWRYPLLLIEPALLLRNRMYKQSQGNILNSLRYRLLFKTGSSIKTLRLLNIRFYYKFNNIKTDLIFQLNFWKIYRSKITMLEFNIRVSQVIHLWLNCYLNQFRSSANGMQDIVYQMRALNVYLQLGSQVSVIKNVNYIAILAQPQKIAQKVKRIKQLVQVMQLGIVVLDLEKENFFGMELVATDFLVAFLSKGLDQIRQYCMFTQFNRNCLLFKVATCAGYVTAAAQLITDAALPIKCLGMWLRLVHKPIALTLSGLNRNHAQRQDDCNNCKSVSD